jgi:hypothetical protein
MHTPGPWTATATDFIFDEPALWTIGDRCGVIAEVQSHNEADARLIAAAPVLLATLRDLLELHIAHHNNPKHAAARLLLEMFDE